MGAACSGNDKRFDISTEGKVHKFHVKGGASTWKTAITAASFEFMPSDCSWENGTATRGNRSYSVTSLQTASPVKMVPKNTPHKSATFMATQESLKKAAAAQDTRIVFASKISETSSPTRVSKTLFFR